MPHESPAISVILPVLNEEKNLRESLDKIRALGKSELIVVDGGSTDHTLQIATTLADIVLVSPKGRAAQMNLGAVSAKGDILLFLHADTQVPTEAFRLITKAIIAGSVWGRFDLHLKTHLASWQRGILSIVATLINWRSAFTGIATGDQAIFVRADIFRQTGGFAAISLMEDIELSHRLKRVSFPTRIKAKVITSARRWEKNGIFRTIFLMWKLRLLFWLGVSPDKLAAYYRDTR